MLLVKCKKVFIYTTHVFRGVVTKEISLNIDIKIFKTGYMK